MRVSLAVSLAILFTCVGCRNQSVGLSGPSSRADLALLAPLMAKPVRDVDVGDTGIDVVTVLNGAKGNVTRVKMLAWVGDGAPRDLGFSPRDSFTIPATLVRRTFLSGTLAGRANIAVVVGSVVEIAGTDSAGVCTSPKRVDLSEITPGRVLKDDVKLEVRPLGDILFDDIIEKQTGFNAGYFAFTANMSNDDRAEVLIQDIAGVQIENYDRDKDTTKVMRIESQPLRRGMCGRYLITGLTLTGLTYRVYHTKKEEAKILGIISIGGKNYYTRSRQANDLAVGITLQPIPFAQDSSGRHVLTNSARPPENTV